MGGHPWVFTGHEELTKRSQRQTTPQVIPHAVQDVHEFGPAVWMHQHLPISLPQACGQSAVCVKINSCLSPASCLRSSLSAVASLHSWQCATSASSTTCSTTCRP